MDAGFHISGFKFCQTHPSGGYGKTIAENVKYAVVAVFAVKACRWNRGIVTVLLNLGNA